MNARLTIPLAVSVVLWAAFQIGCEGQLQSPALWAPGGTNRGGDEFSILLASFSGPDHRNQVRQYKTFCERMTGWSDLWVRDEEEGSELLWGQYGSPEEARSNLKRAKEFRSNAGQPIFAGAVVVPIAGESIGPPEWDLAGADGTYSVMVAVFYNVPEANPPYIGRKKFAVQYCRQLRGRGEEAFYYHGTVRSAVTVGLFGPSAVERVRDGAKVRLVARDPGIQSIIDRFKFLAVNGRQERIKFYNRSERRVEYIPQKPQVVPVPEEDASRRATYDRPGDTQSWEGS